MFYNIISGRNVIKKKRLNTMGKKSSSKPETEVKNSLSSILAMHKKNQDFFPRASKKEIKITKFELNYL